MVTERLLQQIDPRAAQKPGFAGPLAAACAEFAIVAPMEIAAFLAQLAVESGGFTRVEENLNYTSASRLAAIFPRAFPTTADAQSYVGQPARIASRVYAWRLGNGDVASGDGWRYRGRGLIQITGRSNYQACLQALYGNATAEPERLCEPEGAARSAAWFWSRNACRQALLLQGFEATTRIINGPGMAGMAERREAYARALAALGVM
ncbi:MAG: hypothetical protein REI09_11220 [Candidatus Dactylopiibacterium sp.]|nr:hypothetical protein [Candidatus Dactylopiibacterium sp.]